MDNSAMTCQATRRLLSDYLAGELTPSERRLLQNHLGACLNCSADLEAQAALQGRLRSALHARTEPLAPAPMATQRLLARLPHRRAMPLTGGGGAPAPPPPSLKSKGAMLMNPRFVVGTLTALALSVTTAVAAPAARAKVGAFVKTGWHAAVDAFDGDSTLEHSPEARVKTLFPTYLPAGEGWRTDVQTSTDSKVELAFSRGEEFVVLILEPLAPATVSAETMLDAEQYVTINGQTAGLQADLEGSVDAEFHEAVWGWVNRALLQTEASAESDTGLQYKDGQLLTWTTGDMQARLLSNLSLDEMVKVAESLRAAADFNGDLSLALPQLAAEMETTVEAQADTATEAEAETEAAAEVEAEVETTVEAILEADAAAGTAAEVEGAVEATVEAAVDAAGEVVLEVEDALETEVEVDVEADVDVDGEAGGGGGLPLGLP